jgi:hypothetical protein
MVELVAIIFIGLPLCWIINARSKMENRINPLKSHKRKYYH